MVEELIKRGMSSAPVVVRVLTGFGMALLGVSLLFYLVVDNEAVVNPYPIAVPALVFIALIAIIVFSPRQRFDDSIVAIKRAKHINILIGCAVLSLAMVGSAVGFSLSAYYYLLPIPGMVFITAGFHVISPTRLKGTARVLFLCKPALIAIGAIATWIGLCALLVTLYMIGSHWNLDCSSPPGCDLGGGRGYALGFAVLGGVVMLTSLSLLMLVYSILRGAPEARMD